MNTDTDPPYFDEEHRLLDSEYVLEICGSLVRTDMKSEGWNDLGEPAEVRTLTTAHASVIDFLKTQPIQIGSEPGIRFTKSRINLQMAEVCLTYLHYFVEKRIFLSEENVTDYPFARFSAELWDDFYREAIASSDLNDKDMSRLNNLVMDLLSSPTNMLTWVQLCNPDHETDRFQFEIDTSVIKPAMYYAALLGLPDIIGRLVEEGHSVDCVVNSDCGTPLVAACAYGRKEVVSLLLDKSADPTLSGYYW